MNTFAIGSLPVHFSVAKLFNFRWQYTNGNKVKPYSTLYVSYETLIGNVMYIVENEESQSLCSNPKSIGCLDSVFAI